MARKLALFGGTPVVTEPTDFEWPPITPEDIRVVTELLVRREISYYGREGEIAALETAFSKRVGVQFALTCSSGTAALHSAFFGVGLEAGDEVICPTFTFLSTVMPLFVVNAVPVLVDSEPDTGNIDPAAIEGAITPRTRAIVVVHLNGHACNMAPIIEIARKRDLKLIEDCSHAHGATWNFKEVGALGDVSIFSLQGSKLVAAGQGGILLTANREIFERAVMLGHFRLRAFDDVTSDAYRPFSTTGYGLNYRMHPLAAGLARRQFEELDRYIEGRNTNLSQLSTGLAEIPGVSPPPHKAFATRHSYYSYKPLYHEEQLEGLNRRLFIKALKAEGAPVDDSTSLPLHMEPLFQVSDDGSRTYGRIPGRRIYRPGMFPNAEDYAQRALRIPPYTVPRSKLMRQIVDAFEKVSLAKGELLDYGRRIEF